MVAKSRLVHGRACANPGISGTVGRVPVATTTAWRASQDVLGVIGIRHAHCSLAAHPAEPMKHRYTGLPQ